MPVAVNCWVSPAGMLGTFGLAGSTKIEDRVAEFTVRFELPEILPEEAAMVVLPGATDTARPLAFTVAAAVLEELHVTCAVIA